VFMENDVCEVVAELCDNYYAIAFVGKQSKKGWYRSWQRTSKKVFRNLYYSGFELQIPTSQWTTSVWHPTNGYQYMGKQYASV
jgi:hypothetical protein